VGHRSFILILSLQCASHLAVCKTTLMHNRGDVCSATDVFLRAWMLVFISMAVYFFFLLATQLQRLLHASGAPVWCVGNTHDDNKAVQKRHRNEQNHRPQHPFRRHMHLPHSCPHR